MSTAVQQQREKQSRISAFAGTAIVHALIILGLWLLVMLPPDPPLGGGGQGMTMSLGEENFGGPDEIPVIDPAAVDPVPPVESKDDPLATQQIEDAPVVEENKADTKKKSDVVKPADRAVKPVEKPRKVDERSLFKKSTAANAGGHGDGDIPGNEGRPDGDPRGNPDGNGQGDGTGNGIGNGTGNGIGDGRGDGIGNFDLKGRSMSRRPDIEDNSRETGKVVVQIVVDRNGRVLKATPGYQGSTTLSPALLAKAKQAAMEARFSGRPDAPEEQYGTITFIFKFKP